MPDIVINNILLNIIIIIALLPIIIKIIKDPSSHKERLFFLKGIILLIIQSILSITVEFVICFQSLEWLFKILMCLIYISAFFCLTSICFYLLLTLDIKPRIEKKVKILFSILCIIFIVICMFLLASDELLIIQDGIIKEATYFPVTFLFPFVIVIFTMIVAFCKHEDFKNKVYHLLFCLISIIGMVLSLIFHEVFIGIVSKMLGIVIIYSFVYVKRNLDIYINIATSTSSQMEVLKSQLQPHFLFNTLTTIKCMNEINDQRASELTGLFANYLRYTIESITSNSLVTFEKELEFINILEQIAMIRFEGRVKIKYDLNVVSFLIPQFSIIPFVQSAIRNGISKKEDGGLIRLYTNRDEYFVHIEISDNGVGFDPLNDGKDSLGIKSLIEKIKRECCGETTISWNVGEGTKVSIKLPVEEVIKYESVSL